MIRKNIQPRNREMKILDQAQTAEPPPAEASAESGDRLKALKRKTFTGPPAPALSSRYD